MATRARILADYVSSGDELAVTTATADAALPKAGGAMTGAITTNSTFDGVDIAVRDAIHAPKASPAFTGTPTGITAAHLEAGVLPAGVTGGSGLTALGTVATSGTINGMTLSDTGWVSLSSYLVNSWVAYSSGYALYYRKIGNIVSFKGLVKSGTAGSVFSGLPTSLRPFATLHLPIGGLSDFTAVSTSDASSAMDGSGNFSITADAVGLAWASISCTYIAGT